MENAYTFGAKGAVLRQQENVRVIIKGPRVEMGSLTGEAGCRKVSVLRTVSGWRHEALTWPPIMQHLKSGL